jgi:1A family penicillin-binding protein
MQSSSAARQLFRAVATDAVCWIRGVRPRLNAVARLLKIMFSAALLACLVLSSALLWALYSMPPDMQGGTERPSLLLEAADGLPLGRVGPLMDTVDRRAFPQILIDAVLSIEDRRFYSHWGIDPWGILRAAYANWDAEAIVQGGSTITQQLAKLQIVGNERSLHRKIREALTALWLEVRLGKEEVLTRYLNSVYLGSGAYGMAAAARMYFDKEMSQLTLPEAALLAGLIQAPSKYDPIRNLGPAQQRAAVVVDAMLEGGLITAEAAAKTKAEPARLKLSPKTALAGSWYADWIAKHELPKIAGTVKRAMRVRTTIQPRLQQLAQRTIEQTLTRRAKAHGATQAALVAMRADGAVVAMVGGRDYNESQFNRAVDAQRQPGSAFKLFVYYAALRHGYSPGDIIDASPIEIGRWQPDNYGGQQYGHMTLSQAFASSVNSAAIRLALTVGLDKVVAAARELGLDAPLTKVPSMALGTSEVNLLDLTGAFASVRAGHPKLEPWGITAFGADGTGLRLLGAPSTPMRELPHRHDMTELLRAVVERGTGRAAAVSSDAVAGKTGTSQDYRDAWFVGFSQTLVVGVWVGNDDRTPMKRVTGGSLPAEIWRGFVNSATPLLDQTAPRLDLSGTPASAGAPPVPNAQAQCDHTACAAAYRSFRPSDCTYQSYAGARKLCRKGSSREWQMVEPQADGEDGASRVGRRALLQGRAPEQLEHLEEAGSASEQLHTLRRGSGSTLRRAATMPSPNASRPYTDSSWSQASGSSLDSP